MCSAIKHGPNRVTWQDGSLKNAELEQDMEYRIQNTEYGLSLKMAARLAQEAADTYVGTLQISNTIDKRTQMESWCFTQEGLLDFRENAKSAKQIILLAS